MILPENSWGHILRHKFYVRNAVYMYLILLQILSSNDYYLLGSPLLLWDGTTSPSGILWLQDSCTYPVTRKTTENPSVEGHEKAEDLGNQGIERQEPEAREAEN